MTQHACLGISSCTTCIYKACTFSRFLFFNFVNNCLSLDIFTESKEIFPNKESFVLNIDWQLVKIVDDNGLNVRETMQVDLIFIELLDTVHDNDLCFGMISLIEASIGVVGRIYPAYYAVVR